MSNGIDRATAEFEANAVTRQAHASTYCLIDLTNGSDGTVVAVNIGPRYFLATAAHVIQSSHRFKVVLRDSVDGIHDFAARHVHPTHDVGFLELRPEDVPRFGDTFVPPHRIRCHVNQDSEYDVTVIGYPGKLIRKLGQLSFSQGDIAEVRNCSAFTFHSVALPLDEWPSSGTKTPPDPGIDIFISFDPQDSMHLLHQGNPGVAAPMVNSAVPHPAGISGGGIWLLRAERTTPVWQPSAELHGIQFGHNPSGWLRGALIDTWLDVIDNNYPDLQAQVRRIRQGTLAAPTT